MPQETKSMQDLIQDYNDGVYNNKLPYPERKKYLADHVFDEDQSVKWNRVEVDNKNTEISNLHVEYQKESNRLHHVLHEDIVTCLMSEQGINKEQADCIYRKAYEDKHSNMVEVFSYAETLVDLFIELRDLGATS
jgi:hypothetical protein